MFFEPIGFDQCFGMRERSWISSHGKICGCFHVVATRFAASDSLKATRGRVRFPKLSRKKPRLFFVFARSAFGVRCVLASLSFGILPVNAKSNPLDRLYHSSRRIRYQKHS